MNQYLSRLKDSGFFVLCNYFGQKIAQYALAESYFVA